MARRVLWGFAPVLVIGAIVWRERFSGYHQRLAETHFAQSEVYAHAGDAEGARREMALALKEDPKFTEARDGLATIYSSQGNKAEAERLYKEGIRLQPTVVSLRYDLAQIYFTGRQYEKAIAPLEGGARIDPSFMPGMRLLGLCYERAGKVQEALRFWQDCVRRYPDDPIMAHSLARLERQMKEQASTAKRDAATPGRAVNRDKQL